MPVLPLATSLKDSIITVADNGAANSVVLRLIQGTISMSGGIAETHDRYDRGTLLDAIKGIDRPVEISISAIFEQLTGEATDTVESLYEAMLGLGNAAAWVTTGNTNVYEFDMTILFASDPQALGAKQDTITLSNCRVADQNFTLGDTSNDTVQEFTLICRAASTDEDKIKNAWA